MDTQKIDMFLMANSKFFPSSQLGFIRENLLKIKEEKWPLVQVMQFQDPTTCLIVSLLVGGLGVDRFMIGDIGIGVGKLLTCGGMGIWTIVDWFLIMDACRQKNLTQLQQAMY